MRAAWHAVDALPAVGYRGLALGVLTPRLNDAARLTDTDQKTANTLKLVPPEGDIDGVAAAPVMREPAQDPLDIDGRCAPVAKILAKEFLNGAASVEPRDMVDLGLALIDAPDAGWRADPDGMV